MQTVGHTSSSPTTDDRYGLTRRRVDKYLIQQFVCRKHTSTTKQASAGAEVRDADASTSRQLDVLWTVLEVDRKVVGFPWHLRWWHGDVGPVASPLQHYHRNSEPLVQILPILVNDPLVEALEALARQIDDERTI